jgi:TonB family protein
MTKIQRERVGFESKPEGENMNPYILQWGAIAILMSSAWALTRAQDLAATGSFEPPRVVSTMEARYPPNSIASGTVILDLAIDESGGVSAVRTILGVPSLTEEATRTVKQWKFRPALLNGQPVAATFAASFSFVPPVITPGSNPGAAGRSEAITGD